mmetsp:Transcript_48468/g.146228  ORF Transcript_48468/g.146228 Transcript_48468/m.146228 type:complete len:1542 (-) Transcript_48468:47-4672(-)
MNETNASTQQLPERFPRLVVRNAGTTPRTETQIPGSRVDYSSDVIRVPSRSDEYGHDNGRGDRKIAYRRKAPGLKYGADTCFDVLQAGPGEGVVQAFPVGYSDARFLELKHEREKMIATMLDSSTESSHVAQIHRLVKLANVQIVEERDGLVILRCVGPDDRSLNLCVKDAGSGQLYVLRSCWKYVETFTRLTRERPVTLFQLVSEEKNESIFDTAKITSETTFREEDLVPVDDALNEKLKMSMRIERLFDWSDLRLAQQQGYLTWADVRSFVRNVQNEIPFVSSDGLVSHDKYMLSFHQFVAVARLLTDHIGYLARAPAKLIGHTLEVTHCSVRVIVQADRPCRVIAMAAPSNNTLGTILASIKTQCLDSPSSEHFEINDECEKVAIEIRSLSPGTDYFVYLFGEHVVGDEQVLSADADLFQSRLSIRTRTEPEPPLFPQWEGMDDVARSTELLAVVKDKGVVSKALRNGVQVPEVGILRGKVDFTENAWMLFVKWWQQSEARATFCEREVKHALGDNDIQAAARGQGVLCDEGDWRGTDPERLRKWKRFCRWYYCISSSGASGNAKNRGENISNLETTDDCAESLATLKCSSYVFNGGPPTTTSEVLGRDEARVPMLYSNDQPVSLPAVFPFTRMSVKRRGDSEEEACLGGKDSPDLKSTMQDNQPFEAFGVYQKPGQHCNNELAVGIVELRDCTKSNRKVGGKEDTLTQNCNSSYGMSLSFPRGVNVPNEDRETSISTRPISGAKDVRSLNAQQGLTIQGCSEADLDEHFPRGKEASLSIPMPISGVKDTRSMTSQHDLTIEGTNEIHPISGMKDIRKMSMLQQGPSIGGTNEKDLEQAVPRDANESLDDTCMNFKSANKVHFWPTGEDRVSHLAPISKEREARNLAEEQNLTNDLVPTCEVKEARSITDQENLAHGGTNSEDPDHILHTNIPDSNDKSRRASGAVESRSLMNSLDDTMTRKPPVACAGLKSNETQPAKSALGFREKFLMKRTQKIDVAVEKIQEMISVAESATKLKGIALFCAKARIVAMTQRLHKLKEEGNKDATSAGDIANLDLFVDFDEGRFDIDEEKEKKTRRTPLFEPTKKRTPAAVTPKKGVSAILRRKLAALKELHDRQLVLRCFVAMRTWRNRQLLLREYFRLWWVWKNHQSLLRRCFSALLLWREEIPTEPEPEIPTVIVEVKQIDRVEKIEVEKEPDEDLVKLELDHIEREIMCFANEDNYSKHLRILANKLSHSHAQICSDAVTATCTESVTSNFFPAINLQSFLKGLVAQLSERSGLFISDFEYEQEYAEIFERRREFGEKRANGKAESVEGSDSGIRLCNRKNEISSSSTESIITSSPEQPSSTLGQESGRGSLSSQVQRRSGEEVSISEKNVLVPDDKVHVHNLGQILKKWRQFAVIGKEKRTMALAEAECRMFCEVERHLNEIEASSFHLEEELSQEWEARERRRLDHRTRREKLYKRELSCRNERDLERNLDWSKAQLWKRPQASLKHPRLQCHNAYTCVHDSEARFLSLPKPDFYQVKRRRAPVCGGTMI